MGRGSPTVRRIDNGYSEQENSHPFLGTGLAALALGIGTSSTPASAAPAGITGIGSVQVRDTQGRRDADDRRLADHRRFYRDADRDDRDRLAQEHRRWVEEHSRRDRDDSRRGDRGRPPATGPG